MAVVAITTSEMDVLGYLPGIIKQAVTGNGVADKETNQKVAKTMLSIDGQILADTIDGLVIAL